MVFRMIRVSWTSKLLEACSRSIQFSKSSSRIWLESLGPWMSEAATRSRKSRHWFKTRKAYLQTCSVWILQVFLTISLDLCHSCSPSRKTSWWGPNSLRLQYFRRVDSPPESSSSQLCYLPRDHFPLERGEDLSQFLWLLLRLVYQNRSTPPDWHQAGESESVLWWSGDGKHPDPLFLYQWSQCWASFDCSIDSQVYLCL